MLPATLLGVCIHFFPYSPRWLAMVDRSEDSLKALGRLRRLPLDDARIQTEWRGIMTDVAFQRAQTEKTHPGARGWKREMHEWTDLFGRKMIKRTMVACGICFFTQVDLHISRRCACGLTLNAVLRNQRVCVLCSYTLRQARTGLRAIPYPVWHD
jgi:hypothetical protein